MIDHAPGPKVSVAPPAVRRTSPPSTRVTCSWGWRCWGKVAPGSNVYSVTVARPECTVRRRTPGYGVAAAMSAKDPERVGSSIGRWSECGHDLHRDRPRGAGLRGARRALRGRPGDVRPRCRTSLRRSRCGRRSTPRGSSSTARSRRGMDLRRYELATLAAARRMRSSYCMLAHGSVLADRFLGAGRRPRGRGRPPRRPASTPVDVAVMDLADKVADDATRVTQADIDGLRALGLTDARDPRRRARGRRALLLQQGARRRSARSPTTRYADARARAARRADRRPPDRSGAIAGPGRHDPPLRDRAAKTASSAVEAARGAN